VGNPHAGFDVAGAGDGLLGTAPAFDPTCESLKGRFLGATRPPRQVSLVFRIDLILL
jgi:hypothetical protein